MTGPLAPKVVVAADAASFIKKGARLRHWTHLRREGSEGSEGSKGSKGGGIALSGDEFYNAAWRAAYSHFRRGRMTKTPPTITVISTEAERSGEISPSDGTGGITVGDLSTQSIINAFSLCPIPTRSSARDDDPDGQHWTRLRCEGSEGSNGGAIALSGDEFYRPPGEANPFHHWRGPPPPASRGRQVYRGAVPFTPTREYP